MKVVSLINRKGGVGKSTLAVNLAQIAAAKKKTVLLIDLDPQGNAFSWFTRRTDGGNKSPEIAALKADIKDLAAILTEAKRGKVHLVIIDTEGHTNKSTPQAAALSDFVLIPCSPSSYFDLEAMTETFAICRAQKVKAAIIFNKNRTEVFANDMQQNLEGEGFEVLPCRVQDRAAFEWSLFYGKSVFEYDKDNRGAADLQQLFDHLQKRLKI